MTMPFGRYRGRPIEDLPVDYIEWLLTIDINWRLRAALNEELNNRSHCRSGRHARSNEQRNEGRSQTSTRAVNVAIPTEQLTLVRDMVHEGFRVLAKKQHPDVGGDTRKMQVLNAVADLLRGQLKSAVGTGGTR